MQTKLNEMINFIEGCSIFITCEKAKVTYTVFCHVIFVSVYLLAKGDKYFDDGEFVVRDI